MVNMDEAPASGETSRKRWPAVRKGTMRYTDPTMGSPLITAMEAVSGSEPKGGIR